MVAPEAIGPLQRYAALVAEQPIIRLAEPLARELGLREGQIVQASLQTSVEGVAIKLGERLFMLPPGWLRFATGDMRGFQVVRLPTGLGLKLLPPGGGAGPAPQASVPSTLASSPSVTGEPPAAAARVSQALLTQIEGVLTKPVSFESLTQLLRPGTLDGLLSSTPGLQRWATELSLLRLRTDRLDAIALQQAIQASGLWSEALSGNSRSAGQADLKTLLRQVLRMLGPNSSRAEEVSSALDEIERSQVETLQFQSDHRLAFSVMLPFADADPVWLRFEREPRRSAQQPPRYVIDLHLRPAHSVDLWIKSSIAGRNIELTVWAPDRRFAALVAQYSDELAVELADAGLTLQSFRLIETARPGEAEGPTASERRALDVRA